MILQAQEYEAEGSHEQSLDQFFTSTEGKWRTEIGREWAKEIVGRRIKKKEGEEGKWYCNMNLLDIHLLVGEVVKIFCNASNKLGYFAIRRCWDCWLAFSPKVEIFQEAKSFCQITYLSGVSRKELFVVVMQLVHINSIIILSKVSPYSKQASATNTSWLGLEVHSAFDIDNGTVLVWHSISSHLHMMGDRSRSWETQDRGHKKYSNKTISGDLFIKGDCLFILVVCKIY